MCECLYVCMCVCLCVYVCDCLFVFVCLCVSEREAGKRGRERMFGCEQGCVRGRERGEIESKGESIENVRIFLMNTVRGCFDGINAPESTYT